MKTLLIALAGILTVAPMASAKQRLEPAQVIMISPHHHRYYVPAYTHYGPGYYTTYSSTYYDPRYYTEVPATRLYPDSHMGEVQIDTHFKDAMVYVDGGFAGRADKLDEFKLTAGTHDIELRNSSGYLLYHQVIDVLPGKTIKIKI
jgi:PEGA domain-containing protein